LEKFQRWPSTNKTITPTLFLELFLVMKKSQINFQIELDADNLPKAIQWDASDKEGEGLEATKSISLNVWDNANHSTLRIDLWTEEMSVVEMKRFYIDILGGMAQTILNSTGDEYMSEEIKELCDRLVKHVNEENKKGL
jgi:gliding motility-associated protein GldC